MIDKKKVRSTKEWKEFRKKIILEQKVDPITGSKLTKMANCHHLDMSAENYQNLIRDNFIALNPKSHDLIHFLFNIKDKNGNRDYKNAIKRLTAVLDKMNQINEKDAPHI